MPKLVAERLDEPVGGADDEPPGRTEVGDGAAAIGGAARVA